MWRASRSAALSVRGAFQNTHGRPSLWGFFSVNLKTANIFVLFVRSFLFKRCCGLTADGPCGYVAWAALLCLKSASAGRLAGGAAFEFRGVVAKGGFDVARPNCAMRTPVYVRGRLVLGLAV